MNDLIAAEACYHIDCLSIFLRDANRAETEIKSADMAMAWLCQELRHCADKGPVIELSAVFERYKELASEPDSTIPSSYVSRLGTFKETLSKYIGDTYEFVVMRNETPFEKRTLLLPIRFRHIPLSEMACDSTTDNRMMSFYH